MNKFTEMFNIKYPIVQAPIGGLATPELAAAVSNSDAFGGLSLTWSDDEDAEKKILEFNSLSSKPVYVNFVLNYEPKSIKKTLECGIRIIQFSWGMPTNEMIDLIKSFNAKMGIQVTDKNSALRAVSLGADYLVCQGTQAGGHVQASKSLEKALVEILEVTNDSIPVIASGGISSGEDLHRYLKLGASGVAMGSRFVASSESIAHPVYKESLVNSKSDDTVLTVCMNKGWENSLHRIIRNSTFEMWETDGCAVVGNRPGEFDVIGKNLSGGPIERYSISAPVNGVTGNIEAMTFYAGTSVDNIQDIKSVKSIIEDVWNEYLNFL